MNKIPEGVGGAFWIGCFVILLVGCGSIGLGLALPEKYTGVGFLGVLIIGFCLHLAQNVGRK